MIKNWSNTIPAIELKDLSKHYGDFVAVDSINLSVDKGDIFGFIGPNGAGKTTSIKCIIDAIQPSSGSARINGLEVRKYAKLSHKYIGYIPETTTSLYFDLQVKKFLVYSARLKGLSKKNAIERAELMLKLVGLKNFQNRRIGKMSTGMKQRASIAQALITNPEILIADEPTLGLDPVGKNDLLRLMLELKRLNKTIFVSSHSLDELEKIIDHVAVINKGKISYAGTVQDLQTEFKPDVFYIRTDNQEMLADILYDQHAEIISKDKYGFTIKLEEQGDLDWIVQAIYRQNFRLQELKSVESPLERLFFNSVSNNDSQDAIEIDLVAEVLI